MQSSATVIQMVLQTLAPRGQERDSRRNLCELTQRLDSSSGVVRAFVLADATDPRRTVLVEEWTDAESMVREMRTDRFRALLSFVQSSAFAHSISFRSVTERDVLELVAEAHPEIAEPALPSEGGPW